MKEVPCDTCEFLNDTSLHPPCLICNEENNWECYEKYDPNKKDVVGDSIKDLNKNAPQPCPWCGDTDVGFKYRDTNSEWPYRSVWIQCERCNARGPASTIEITKYDSDEGKDVALEDWNTRYTPDNSIEGMIKRLEGRDR